MSKIRFKALHDVQHRPAVTFESLGRPSSLFKSNVFGDQAMRQFLSKSTIDSVQTAIRKGDNIDRITAEPPRDPSHGDIASRQMLLRPE